VALYSPRPGGFGKCDLWVTNRTTKEANWGTPVNLGSTVNSSAHECDPSISADGLSLYFDSDRPGGKGSVDLWVATRASVSNSWGTPVHLEATVNSPAVDAFPSISADGLLLFFMSDRTGDYDLWVTKRPTTADPWNTPINLGPGVNSSSVDACPTISHDASTLYFMSMRPGGIGGLRDLWRVSIEPVVDLNGDGIVDCADMCIMVDHWLTDDPLYDIAPRPFGDGIVDVQDLIVLAEHLLEEYAEIVHIQWLGHSTVKLWTEDCVVYVDPERLTESLHDATLVCVTHTHGDHYSPSDIARVSNPDTQFIAPPDVIQQYGSGESIAPGQTIDFDFVSVTAVPAYNTNKPNHPKANNWVGYIIEIASKHIYVAGDTDLIEEMKTLGHIDVAILPAGGTYTMNAAEAAEATRYIKPELAIPYHWGRNVGTLSDAERFAEMADCNVKIMSLGEILSSEDWLKDFSMIAHWKLDEMEGNIAQDSAGEHDGTLYGDPAWQPEGGMVDGALELDGIGDYVSAPFVLNPADGKFSVFAWIKGGAPGQVVISQTELGGANWLLADSSEGNLMTELKALGRGAAALLSQTVITDGNWHRVGFVWDGSHKTLYVDGVAVAEDTQTGLESSEGGLYLGVGKAMEPGTYWSGLIDDVRIYNRVVIP